MESPRKLPLLPTKASKETDVEKLYEELKHPKDDGWQYPDKAYTIEQLQKCIAEGANICLKFQQWDWEDGVRIAVLDIDNDTDEIREAVDKLGELGALVFRTRRGYHCIMRIADSVYVSKSKVDNFYINSKKFDIGAELYVTGEKYKKKANRQYVVPVEGTPRAKHPRCCVLYDRGRKIGRPYTLQELVEALDALGNAAIVPFELFKKMDVGSFSNRKQAYNAIQLLKDRITREIGSGWENGLESICNKIRNAQQGRRNDTLYYGALGAALLGIDEEQIRENLLEAAKEVFTIGDREFDNDYQGAKDTINSAINGYKEFAEKAGAVGVHIRPPKSNSEERVRSGVNELAIISDFKLGKAKVYTINNDFHYILYKNYAISLDNFPAFVLKKFGVRLTDAKAKSIFTILVSDLPHVNKNSNIHILGSWPGEVVDVYLARSSAYIQFVKYLVNDSSGDVEQVAIFKTQLGYLKDAFLKLREKFGDICKDEFDDLWNYIRQIPDDYYSNNVITTYLVDKTQYEGGVLYYKTKDVYDIYLKLDRVNQDGSIDAQNRVYVIYNPTGFVRQVSFKDLFEFLAGIAINPSDLRDEESKITRCKEIISFINKVLGRYSQNTENDSIDSDKLTAIRLCSTDDLKYNSFRWYVADLARFHSYSDFEMLQRKEERMGNNPDDWYKRNTSEVQGLLAKSVLVLNALSTRGLFVVTGPSGSGKSVFLTRCGVIANGVKVKVNANDERDIQAAMFHYIFLPFDDYKEIVKDSISKLKSWTSGEEVAIRLYHTITKVIIPTITNLCVAIAAVDVKAMDEDMSRRGFMFEFGNNVFSKPISKADIPAYAGMDLLYFIIIRSLVITSIMKYSRPELKMPEKDVAGFIASSNNAEVALSYYKLCHILDIDFEILKGVYAKATGRFAENNLTGGWKLVYEMISEKPKLLDEFKKPLLAAKIAELLKENGFIEESEEKSVKDSLASKAKYAAAALRQLGYMLTIEKDGRYNKYKLQKIDFDNWDGGGGATGGDAPQDSTTQNSFKEPETAPEPDWVKDTEQHNAESQSEKPPIIEPPVTLSQEDRRPAVTIPELNSFLELLQKPDVGSLMEKFAEMIEKIKSLVSAGVTNSELVKDNIRKFVFKHLNPDTFRFRYYPGKYKVDFKVLLTWELAKVYWNKISSDPITPKEYDVLRKYIGPIIDEVDPSVIEKLKQDYESKVVEC